MADEVHPLLLVGFILLFLRAGEKLEDMRQGIESISTKLGIVMQALGGRHLLTMFHFSRMPKRWPDPNPPPWHNGTVGESRFSTR